MFCILLLLRHNFERLFDFKKMFSTWSFRKDSHRFRVLTIIFPSSHYLFRQYPHTPCKASKTVKKDKTLKTQIKKRKLRVGFDRKIIYFLIQWRATVLGHLIEKFTLAVTFTYNVANHKVPEILDKGIGIARI